MVACSSWSVTRLSFALKPEVVPAPISMWFSWWYPFVEPLGWRLFFRHWTPSLHAKIYSVLPTFDEHCLELTGLLTSNHWLVSSGFSTKVSQIIVWNLSILSSSLMPILTLHFLSIPEISTTQFQRFTVNWMNLSQPISAGMPKFGIQWWVSIALAQSSFIGFSTGTASNQPVNLSIIVCRYILSAFVLNRPVMPMQILPVLLSVSILSSGHWLKKYVPLM